MFSSVMFITRVRPPELSLSTALKCTAGPSISHSVCVTIREQFCSSGDWLPTGLRMRCLNCIPFLNALLQEVIGLQYNDSLQFFQAVLNIGAKLCRDICQMINNVFCLEKRTYWFNNLCCLKWRIHSTEKRCFTPYPHQTFSTVPVRLTKKWLFVW